MEKFASGMFNREEEALEIVLLQLHIDEHEVSGHVFLIAL